MVFWPIKKPKVAPLVSDLPFTEEDIIVTDDVGSFRVPTDLKVGVKFDENKLRMDLIPPEAIEALALTLTKGAQKYGDRNWEKGIDPNRCIAALMRHLMRHMAGEEFDPDSGQPHMDHVLTNAVFVVTYQRREADVDAD